MFGAVSRNFVLAMVLPAAAFGRTEAESALYDACLASSLKRAFAESVEVLHPPVFRTRPASYADLMGWRDDLKKLYDSIAPKKGAAQAEILRTSKRYYEVLTDPVTLEVDLMLRFPSRDKMVWCSVVGSAPLEPEDAMSHMMRLNGWMDHEFFNYDIPFWR